MPQLRNLTDEDVYGAVAVSLRRAGVDSVSTPEAGRRAESDQSQLVWAAGQGRAIVTFNVGHFARLHSQWMQQGVSHAGIIVSSQRTVGDTLRRLVHLTQTLDADAMCDRLEFLSDW